MCCLLIVAPAAAMRLRAFSSGVLSQEGLGAFSAWRIRPRQQPGRPGRGGGERGHGGEGHGGACQPGHDDREMAEGMATIHDNLLLRQSLGRQAVIHGASEHRLNGRGAHPPPRHAQAEQNRQFGTE